MSQPKLSVETQTSIYNCLCMLLLDCFRGTKYSMYENHAPPPHMLLCEFHHPPISLYIIKNSNFSFKPTLSNNHVQTILFSEAQLETISFFPHLFSIQLCESLCVPDGGEHLRNWLLAGFVSLLLIPLSYLLVTSVYFLPLLFPV